jgi:hypothetical protein
MGRIKIIKPITPTMRAVVIFIPPHSPIKLSPICAKWQDLVALNVGETLMK